MGKQPVAIVTDSTSCLPDGYAAEKNIPVIPMVLNWGVESILDGVDITPTQFYERLATSTEVPSTSQPNVAEFRQFFEKAGQNADSILGIFISDELSGTLASARGAAELLSDMPITIIDSRFAATGLGLLVMAAVDAAEAGLEPAAVADRVRALIPQVRTLFVVDTLEYLHRGGRIGGAQRLIGSVLSMKPVLQLKDGVIEPLKSVRTKKKAIRFALDHMIEETTGQGNLRLAIMHANSLDLAKQIQAELDEALHPFVSVIADVSPVIGTHVGPGTIGFAYYAE